MIINNYGTDENAERVHGHKFVFTRARTILASLSFAEMATPCFASTAGSAPNMYAAINAHHAKIRFAVSISVYVAVSSPFMVNSMVSRQCRLKGTIISGNSLCHELQALQ